MKFFAQQKFDRAQALLEPLRACPYRHLADRANLHWNACNDRLRQENHLPRTAEECYQQAIVRMNVAQYEQANELLQTARQTDNTRADFTYALACLRALTGDTESALRFLQEAIAQDKQIRLLARSEHDFDRLMDDPRFTEILYPERG